MRKRKPPVLLATVLVFMLVAVGIFYAPRGSGDGHGHDHGAQASNTPPPPAAETGSRPKVDPKQVAGMAKGAMARPASSDSAGPMGGPDGTPSIALPKPSNHRPTPNDSSTSTQWYTDQTRK